MAVDHPPLVRIGGEPMGVEPTAFRVRFETKSCRGTDKTQAFTMILAG